MAEEQLHLVLEDKGRTLLVMRVVKGKFDRDYVGNGMYRQNRLKCLNTN
jgi:hypothetical protein